MKKLFIILLAALILSGCGTMTAEITPPTGVETESPETEGSTETESIPETDKEPETVPDTDVIVETEPETEPPVVEEIPDLTGAWIQKSYAEKDTFMFAAIDSEKINILWYMDGGETIAVYWDGTFTAPTASGDYSWDSTNTLEDGFHLLASGDETKTFKY